LIFQFGISSFTKNMTNIIPIESIEQSIYIIRNQKVMLDADLAKLYNVQTFNLNKSVKRNINRFPNHFMFQLTNDEFILLKEMLETKANTPKRLAKANWGGRRTTPYAFTEQGVAMLSSILKSDRAIQVNIAIMDTFVKLRQMISTHKDLTRKITSMEKKYDHQFRAVFDALRQLMEPSKTKKKLIGFERK